MSLTIENIVQRLKEAKTQTNLNKSKIYFSERANRSDAYLEFLYKNWANKHSTRFEDDNTAVIAVVLLFYILILLVSIFGNSIVCKVVFGNSRAKSIINLYVGNLSVSDIMMTVINIPLQLTEILIRNWRLGLVLCKFLHFIGSLTICVSTLTMTCIALDRFRVIAYPLKPRPSLKSTVNKIILIWIAACLLSSPYAWISEIKTDFSYTYMIRCRLVYPDPEVKSRVCFTLITLAIKFVIPLTVAGITYLRICIIIWKRRPIGLPTPNQQKHQHVAKWKTIKMLLIVLIVFVTCWSPQMIYHTYQDILGNINYVKKHKSTIWLVCHWFAMSSVCFNPFIYCWLNSEFQKAAKEQFRCCSVIRRKKPQEPEASFLPKSCNEELLLPRSSSDSRREFSQQATDIFCEEQLTQLDTEAKNNSQLNILQLRNTVAKVLKNHSVTVSVCTTNENEKTEILQICNGNRHFTKSESEALA